VGQIVNIFAIFPQGHTLIVVPTALLFAHAMRIANEEASNLLLDAEVNHFAGGFVSQVTNAPLSTSTLLVFGMLQTLPATGVLSAPGLLLSNLAQLFASLTFERPDAAPGDDHGLAGIGGDGSQVDFAQIYGSLDRSRSLFCLW